MDLFDMLNLHVPGWQSVLAQHKGTTQSAISKYCRTRGFDAPALQCLQNLLQRRYEGVVAAANALQAYAPPAPAASAMPRMPMHRVRAIAQSLALGGNLKGYRGAYPVGTSDAVREECRQRGLRLPTYLEELDNGT